MNYTCGGCSNTWGGLAMAHCSVCHDTYSGITSFDRHRNRGKCVNPETYKNEDGELVFERRTSGKVPIWAFPTDIDFAERFAKGGLIS